MNKLDKIFIKYAFWSLPLILFLIVWGSMDNPDALSKGEGVSRLLWDFLGWILMIWILASLYLALRTIFSINFRNIILTKIAKIKERDEREEAISGQASKFAFFSTLAILFFFLFLSLFTVTVGRDPDTAIKDDKTGYIKIGMNFKPFDLEEIKRQTTDATGRVIVDYSDLPITKAGLLLFLILWQIGSYHYFARKTLGS